MKPTDAIRLAAWAAASVMLTGCSGWQSTLDPHSSQAAHLRDLFFLFTIVCTVVWLLVVAALALVLLRRNGISAAPEEDTATQRHKKNIVVGILVGATAAILVVFTLTSFYTTRGFAWSDDTALKIKVTGQQWWWQIEYPNRDPSQIFVTANEIHIPVGRPVTLDLEASDVIHSFWVPNLMGKQDLIPGRKNSLTIQADRPGLYRGQCAEFCGLEHAHMAIFVLAEPQAQFDAWRRHQLQSATPPRTPLQVRGLTLFLHGTCSSCHAVQGTGADAQFGPDLTHFGSRATIAAGLLHNDAADLDRWLADPQALKPGANMPQVPLSEQDRHALVAYLEGLQ
jgi:cytochrome c oxidase subunit 2